MSLPTIILNLTLLAAIIWHSIYLGAYRTREPEAPWSWRTFFSPEIRFAVTVRVMVVYLAPLLPFLWLYNVLDASRWVDQHPQYLLGLTITVYGLAMSRLAVYFGKRHPHWQELFRWNGKSVEVSTFLGLRAFGEGVAAVGIVVPITQAMLSFIRFTF